MRRLRNCANAFVFRLAVVCLCAGAANAQEPETAPPSDEEQLKLWRQLYVELAEQHTFTVRNEKADVVEFRPQPLHFYSNPAGGTQTHGSIFVWTRGKRPVVIGALWSRKIKDERRVSASLHSASSDKLNGFRNGEEFWNPTEGLAMQAWPRNDAPAASPQRRLVQMRNMMRDLDATRTDKDRRSSLRVLPQPLYRFANDDVIDGAVFGFFEDWDPELFVLVEATKERPDRWRVGMIRFSNKLLTVGLGGKRIWNYDPSGTEPPFGGTEFRYVSKIVDVRPVRLAIPASPTDE